MTSIDLELTLTRLVASALADEFGSEADGVDPSVRPSKFADYQVNSPLALGKKLGQPPRQVAQALADRLASHSDFLEAVEVSGPGFVNCTFANTYLAALLTQQAADDRLGRPVADDASTVVVDYGGPNVAKEMAVHHLRSTVIGDSLVRIIEARGDEVVKQNHLGDWGTQFGMLTEYLIQEIPEAKAGKLEVSDLDELYRTARAKFESDEEFKTKARERVVALQRGDSTTTGLWQLLVDESKRHFDDVFRRLGVLLTEDDYRGESMYNDQLDDTVDALSEKGLLFESEGALCTFPEGFRTPDDEPLPMIVRKSDGGYGYQATDLAAVRYAVDHDGANIILYVVDGRQAQHFAMIIATSRDAGWLDDNHNAQHVPFGMMMGKDGKPFKTRSGNNYKLIDLLDDALAKALEEVQSRRPDMPSDEQLAVAEAVSVAAVKWADLKNDRTQNYVFDLDAMISFEGNTGPYVQYAAARANSVIRKAGGALPDAPLVISEPAERQLALQLNAYGAVVEHVATSYEPHLLCTYLFELASRFSSFYDKVSILKADSDKERASRLRLCDLTSKVMSEGLDLLGIRALDRM